MSLGVVWLLRQAFQWWIIMESFWIKIGSNPLCIFHEDINEMGTYKNDVFGSREIRRFVLNFKQQIVGKLPQPFQSMP